MVLLLPTALEDNLHWKYLLLEFPTERFGDKPDYSNFNRTEWNKRSNQQHREDVAKYRLCNTQSQVKDLERENGVRYSVLVDLPYSDAPLMCIIDSMHNLLLGTAKHMIAVWKKIGLLEDRHFPIMQQTVDGFIAPNGSGRQPTLKISSGFAGSTAEQWILLSIFT